MQKLPGRWNGWQRHAKRAPTPVTPIAVGHDGTVREHATIDMVSLQPLACPAQLQRIGELLEKHHDLPWLDMAAELSSNFYESRDEHPRLSTGQKAFRRYSFAMPVHYKPGEATKLSLIVAKNGRRFECALYGDGRGAVPEKHVTHMLATLIFYLDEDADSTMRPVPLWIQEAEGLSA